MKFFRDFFERGGGRAFKTEDMGFTDWLAWVHNGFLVDLH